jgi:hypothetical protein
VCHAVNGLVRGFGGKVVEHDHRGAIAGEIVLNGEDLPPVAQRALRQQADFREAVEDDAGRPGPLDGIENLLSRFAKFQVGRIQQALLLFWVEQALRGNQLEDIDVRPQRPAVRSRALTKLFFSL